MRSRPAAVPLTKLQERKVRKLAGHVTYERLAKMIGTSRSNLMRWARENHVSLDSLSHKPHTVKAVLAFYERHGRAATEKQFPHIRIRSIIERHPSEYKARQIRWTPEQIVELARMGGVITYDAQAKYFARPGANAGSIKSAWMKRFELAGGSINGMSNVNAKHFVDDSCPRVRTKFWEQRKASGEYGRQLCLWVDMEKHLRPDVPAFIQEAIESLASFQRWLFSDHDPRPKILKLIEQREIE